MALLLLPNAPAVRAEMRNYGILSTKFGADADIPTEDEVAYVGLINLPGDSVIPAAGCCGQAYNIMEYANILLPVSTVSPSLYSDDSGRIRVIVTTRGMLKSQDVLTTQDISANWRELNKTLCLLGNGSSTPDDFVRQASMERVAILQSEVAGVPLFDNNATVNLHLLYT